MLVKSVAVARPVKIVQNSANKGNQWGQVLCASTGVVLHTGQLSYIQQVARKRYNVKVSFVK